MKNLCKYFLILFLLIACDKDKDLDPGEQIEALNKIINQSSFELSSQETEVFGSIDINLNISVPSGISNQLSENYLMDFWMTHTIPIGTSLTYKKPGDAKTYSTEISQEAGMWMSDFFGYERDMLKDAKAESWIISIFKEDYDKHKFDLSLFQGTIGQIEKPDRQAVDQKHLWFQVKDPNLTPAFSQTALAIEMEFPEHLFNDFENGLNISGNIYMDEFPADLSEDWLWDLSIEFDDETPAGTVMQIEFDTEQIGTETSLVPEKAYWLSDYYNILPAQLKTASSFELKIKLSECSGGDTNAIRIRMYAAKSEQELYNPDGLRYSIEQELVSFDLW